MARGIITFKSLGRYGRFANQLYQIAGTIGIARKNGYDFAFPEFINHDALNFGETADIEVQKYFENPLPIYAGPELPQVGIAWGYFDVTVSSHRKFNVHFDRAVGKYTINHNGFGIDLLGHFQSARYFAHCLEEVRWYLTLKDEPPMNDYCAIHWRAGDYGEQASPQHPNGNPYHPRMQMNYYTPAMAQFPANQKYLVFSDDIDGAKKMFGDRVEYSEGRDYIEDFKLMKRCQHFIISNSSYSAMAALLSEAPDKKVVAPHPWFGGPYLETLDPKDIYDPTWTKINWRPT